jgi:hypothetical protein
MQVFQNISDARLALGELVAYDQYPTLADHEMEDVLMRCRVKDAAGLPVSDRNYCLTIDMMVAASRCWARKAGRAAGDFEFQSDNQKFSREQIIKHCLQMQRYYQSQTVGSWPAPTTNTKARFELPIGWGD